MLDRWLLPGSIILAAIVLALTFRVDVSATGSYVVLYDRFDGSVTGCSLVGPGGERCGPP